MSQDQRVGRSVVRPWSAQITPTDLLSRHAALASDVTQAGFRVDRAIADLASSHQDTL